MQNKKFLSILLSLVLVCTCVAGMLILNVSGADEAGSVPVFKEYTVEQDGKISETLKLIATDVKGNFTNDDSAVANAAKIILESGSYAAEISEEGLLFGAKTIFLNGERLPITITKAGGAEASITFSEVTAETNVACANSYTFEDIGFYAADAPHKVNFYAGSGEVTLKNVRLVEDLDAGIKKANVNFYADNFTAAAFEGWTDPGEGKITTSLTLNTVDYSWSDASMAEVGSSTATTAQVNGVGWTGETYTGEDSVDVTAEDVAVKLNIVNSQITGVHARPRTALSPVASLELNISGEETEIPQLTGVGDNCLDATKVYVKDVGTFDFTVNISGGTFGESNKRILFFGYVQCNGYLTVNISGGTFNSDVVLGYGHENSRGKASYVTNEARATISGGTFNGTLYGPNVASADLDRTVAGQDDVADIVEITGGTIARYEGNRGPGSIKTTVKSVGDSSPTITNYYGTYFGTADTTGKFDYVVNKFEGGSIENFFGTGYDTTVRPGTDYAVGNVINDFTGGTITSQANGAGHITKVENVTNNLQGTTFFISTDGKTGAVFRGTTAKGVDGSNVRGTLTNNIKDGYVSGAKIRAGNLYLVGGSMEGSVVTDIKPAISEVFKQTVFAGSKCEITGNFTYNLENVSMITSYAASTMLNDIKAKKVTVVIDGKAAIFSNQTARTILGDGIVAADIELTMKNMSVSKSSACTVTLAACAATNALTVNLENVSMINKANMILTSVDQPNMQVTYNGVTTTAQTGTTHSGLTSNVSGKYTRIFKGQNYFKNGAFPAISGGVEELETVFVNDAMVNGNAYRTTHYGGAGINAPETVTYVYDDPNTVFPVNDKTIDAALANSVKFSYALKIAQSVNYNINVVLKNIANTEEDFRVLYMEQGADVNGNVGITIEDSTFEGPFYATAVFKTGCNINGTLDVNYDNVVFNGIHYGYLSTQNTSYGPILTGLLTTNAKDVTSNAAFYDIRKDANAQGGLKAMYDNCTFNGSIATVFRAVGGDVVCNEFKDCTFAGGGGTLNYNKAAVYIYGNTVVGNGSNETTLRLNNAANCNAYIGAKPGEGGPVLVDTTLTIKEGAKVYAYEANLTSGSAKIYNVVVKGSGTLAPDADNTAASTFTLVGKLQVPNGENPQIYLNAAEGTASVAPAAGEKWEAGKVYVTMTGDNWKEELDKISFATPEGCTGEGEKYNQTIIGKITTMFSAVLEERIYIKLWIPKTKIQNFIDKGETNLEGVNGADIGATLSTSDSEGRPLGFVTVDQAYVDNSENIKTDAAGNEYVIVRLGAVGANEFNNEITFLGSSEILGIDYDETYTMLELVGQGVGQYANDPIWSDVFTALYNYGASVCDGVEQKSIEIELTDEGVAPEAAPTPGENVNFDSMFLLMGDAIGYRFQGTETNGITNDDITITVNGEACPYFRLYTNVDDVDPSIFWIDLYVSFDAVADALEFKVKALGATLDLTSSLKGYSKTVAGDGPRELALANLVQAVYNIPSEAQN